MNIIVRPNNTNKTRDLIDFSIKTDTPIFAAAESKARSLQEKSLAYFGAPVKVITMLGLREYTGSILVDDLDKAFISLLEATFPNSKVELSGFTVTSNF